MVERNIPSGPDFAKRRRDSAVTDEVRAKVPSL
jgi:hypothetical protein